MKFEKFFKMAGTHGQIVKRNESESWLVRDHTGEIVGFINATSEI